MSEASAIQYLTVPDLVELLGESVSRIHRLVEEHHLPGWKVDGVFKVPADFVLHGETISSMRGTMVTLLDAGFTTDEAVKWLITDNDELGERPIDTLRAGHKAAVRRAVQGLAF